MVSATLRGHFHEPQTDIEEGVGHVPSRSVELDVAGSGLSWEA